MAYKTSQFIKVCAFYLTAKRDYFCHLWRSEASGEAAKFPNNICRLRAARGNGKDAANTISDWRKTKKGAPMTKRRESPPCALQTLAWLSPLGTIRVDACDKGVHAIRFLMDVAPAERSGEGPPSLRPVNGGSAETSPELRRCLEWLRAYFADPSGAGTLPPPPAFHHPALGADTFTSRVLHVLFRDVKVGETVSYKQLAEMAGNPRAARAVGGAMRKNPKFPAFAGHWKHVATTLLPRDKTR
ncbi:methylated-DNA--protein-cysteine methyltransferase isoform X2 [Syngnathus scovelli]|uniref:methylated-DNA--protein-cysteine methyltransferase isoform X2 n=1 Tax=Syngnathus scovelli TaxID=161590 RepID=UPI0035CA0146